MVYSSINTIKRQMEASDARYWTVWDSRGNLIAAMPPDEAKANNSTHAFEKLKEVLDDTTGDYVEVTVKVKEGNKNEDGTYNRGNVKGQQIYNYYVALVSPSGNAINGVGDRNMLEQIFELKQQLRDKEADIRYEKLQQQIAGLVEKKSDDSVLNKFIGRIADNIADRFTGAEIKKALNREEPEADRREDVKQPVASNVAPEEEKDIVVDFLRSTGEAMGDQKLTLEAIAALAKFAKKKPGVFKETAEELIKQAPEE